MPHARECKLRAVRWLFQSNDSLYHSSIDNQHSTENNLHSHNKTTENTILAKKTNNKQHFFNEHGLGPYGMVPHGLGTHDLGPHGFGSHGLRSHWLGTPLALAWNPIGLGPHRLWTRPHGLRPLYSWPFVFWAPSFCHPNILGPPCADTLCFGRPAFWAGPVLEDMGCVLGTRV